MGIHIAHFERNFVRSMVALISAFLMILLILSGCSSPSGGDSQALHGVAGDSSPVTPPGPEGERARMEGLAQDVASEGASEERNPLSISPTKPAEKLIVTAQARVQADDPKAAFASVEKKAGELGGSISSSVVATDGGYPRVSATVRIPAEKFTDFMAGLESYGNVVERSTHTQDVGAEIADNDARIQALEKSIERLTTLMGQASSTADLLEAETQLTHRQAELDALKSQQRWYADQVAMSTLDITFVSSVSFAPESNSVWRQSWDAFVYGVTGVVIVVVWLLPWAVLVAALVLPLVLWRKKKRARALAHGTLPVRTPVDSPKEDSVSVGNNQN